MIKKKDGFLGEQQVVLSPMLINMQEADPLTSSLFITDIGYYPKAEHHHRIREQAIDQYVLIYCVDGNGFYVVLAYFNKLKIERACELLKKTDLKINQICYKIGIEDPFYFSRLFSKTIGMSPTKYKEIRT